MRWKLIAAIGAAVVVAFAVAAGAGATTKITVDSGWQSFITGGIDGASTAGPWVFTSTTVVKVTVTDAFCRGDEFRVYDRDVLLGDTSDVVSEFPDCRSSCSSPRSREQTPRSPTRRSATASSS